MFGFLEKLWLNILEWLGGTFICKRCGQEFHAKFFGRGYCLCPDCYNGEKKFIFPIGLTKELKREITV